MDFPELEYAGFWRRFVASLIDTVLLVVITWPLLYLIYGPEYFAFDSPIIMGRADFYLSWVFPAFVAIWFWVAGGGATPGKRVVGARVVDSRTGEAITVGKGVVRYIGYFVSLLGLCIGYLWVAFDSKKQGWHDHLAGTVVVRYRPVVRFESGPVSR